MQQNRLFSIQKRHLRDIPPLFLVRSMEAVFWKLRREDSPHMICDDAETLRICILVPKQRVTVTGAAVQGAEGPVWIETVDTIYASFFALLSNTCFPMTIVVGMVSVGHSRSSGPCWSHHESSASHE